MTEPLAPIDDPHAFLTQLVASTEKIVCVAGSLATLSVDRDRTLADRFAGRDGTVTGLRLETPTEWLTLTYESGPRWHTEVARVSGGVIISRRTPPLGEWLSFFAGHVAALAADTQGDAAAAARALHALGIQPAAPDIRVRDGEFATDLAALPAKLAGRVPDEAIEVITRIAQLLIDSGARVVGQPESQRIIERTATTYLPDTIRAYLSLPADWVTTHVFTDGLTAEAKFLEQLGTLETAVARMHESAVARDADALLTNGRFLAAKFPNSSLEL